MEKELNIRTLTLLHSDLEVTLEKNLNMGALGDKITNIGDKDQSLLKAKRIAEASSP